MTMGKIFILLSLSLSLLACASNKPAPESFYYILDVPVNSIGNGSADGANNGPSNKSVNSAIDKAINSAMSEAISGTDNTTKSSFIVSEKTHIKVQPVNLPNYLNQPNLVLKLSNHQIKIANYHFWAQDLSMSIQRVIINDLNSATRDFMYTQSCAKCDELIISIDHFYPTEQGDVVLSGTYEKISMDGQHEQTRFSLSKALTQGGYDEAVAAMRELLGELAQSIL